MNRKYTSKHFRKTRRAKCIPHVRSDDRLLRLTAMTEEIVFRNEFGHLHKHDDKALPELQHDRVEGFSRGSDKDGGRIGFYPETLGSGVRPERDLLGEAGGCDRGSAEGELVPFFRLYVYILNKTTYFPKNTYHHARHYTDQPQRFLPCEGLCWH